MIHEFEEIIFIKKFIEKNKVVKYMKNELFLKKREIIHLQKQFH